jgi:phage baseplate assembly protein W
MISNYSFPLRCAELMKKKPDHPKCSTEESVRQHIYLMLITRFGENRYDTSYGCELWEYDFESLKILDGKKHYLENSIKNLLFVHEPRLTELNVAVNISEGPVMNHLKTEQKTKKKIEINIKGRLAETNKPFDQPPFTIYFSPVTADAFFRK